ncbi:MAG: hypothetical protein ABIZ09_05480, partial [Rhodoferax sp.]
GLERLTPSIVRKDYFLVFTNSFYASSSDTVNKLWQLIPELKKTQGEALDKKYELLTSDSISIF